MSDNQVNVEFGGKIDPSFPSSLDRIRASVAAQKKDFAEMSIEVARHAAVTVAGHKLAEVAMGQSERGASVLSASFGALRVAARMALADVMPTATRALSGFSLVFGSVKILSGALYVLEKASGTATAGLSKFAFTEDLANRLRKLTGSAEAARQKLGEIAETFRGTPIAVPDAVDAYRSARVADSGSGELSSGKGLTMLGELAAGSTNNIREVTAAVGKLYGDLQSGQPIKESADKLREMGIISGETRQQIDRLLASGKSGPEVWSALRGEFERSAGAMKDAQDTLTGLQKAVQDAKSQLYESFGKGSADFEKDKLKGQSVILQKLQPVAEEAGDVYGSAKSSVSGFIKLLLELVGIKAATDKALGSGDGLKLFTDGVLAAGAGVVAFAAAAVLAVPALIATNILTVGIGAALTGVVAAAAAFAAVVAVVVAAGAGALIYAHHLNEVAKAQLAFANGTADLVNGLEKERDAINSVAEKAAFLAKAYATLKQAREALANAKTPEDRQLAQTRVEAVQVEIRAAEGNSGVLQRQRAQVAKDIENAKTEEERNALVLRHGQLTERINRGDRATDKDLTPTEARAKIQAELDERHNKPADEEDAAQRAEAVALAAKRKASDLDTRAFNAEKAAAPEEIGKVDAQISRLAGVASSRTDPRERAAARQEIGTLETRKAGLPQLAESARTDAVAGQLAAEKAADAATEARKKATEAQERKAKEAADKEKEARQERINLATADAEAQLAAVGSEGIQRAREEYEIRRQLLEIKLREAEAEGDAVKLAALRADYYRDQVGQGRKEEEASRTVRDDTRALEEARDARMDAADRRKLKHDFADGTITDEQRRQGEAEILQRQRAAAETDAVQKESDANEARKKGDEAKALRLERDAENLRSRSDTLGGEREDVLNPRTPWRHNTIADDLQRIGGGGSAYYGSDQKNHLEAKTDRLIKLHEDGNRLLKEVGQKIDRQRVL